MADIFTENKTDSGAADAGQVPTADAIVVNELTEHGLPQHIMDADKDAAEMPPPKRPCSLSKRRVIPQLFDHAYAKMDMDVDLACVEKAPLSFVPDDMPVLVVSDADEPFQPAFGDLLDFCDSIDGTDVPDIMQEMTVPLEPIADNTLEALNTALVMAPSPLMPLCPEDNEIFTTKQEPSVDNAAVGAGQVTRAKSKRSSAGRALKKLQPVRQNTHAASKGAARVDVNAWWGAQRRNLDYFINKTRMRAPALDDGLTEADGLSMFANCNAEKPALPAELQAKLDSAIAEFATATKLLASIEALQPSSDACYSVEDYTNAIYNHLYSVELQQLVPRNHLYNQVKVTPVMRGILVNWMYKVYARFGLTTETYQLAVGIMDRYFAMVNTTKGKHFQLIGATALYIAAKTENAECPPVSSFAQATNSAYSNEQIYAYEPRLLQHFNLQRPTPIHFLRHYVKAAELDRRHFMMCVYFVELCTNDYTLASVKPSEMAAATLFLVLNLLMDSLKSPTGLRNNYWTPDLERHTRYSAKQLAPTTQKIAVVARNAPKSNLKAIFNKYNNDKFFMVAVENELYGSQMDSIIAGSD